MREGYGMSSERGFRGAAGVGYGVHVQCVYEFRRIAVVASWLGMVVALCIEKAATNDRTRRFYGLSLYREILRRVDVECASAPAVTVIEARFV